MGKQVYQALIHQRPVVVDCHWCQHQFDVCPWCQQQKSGALSHDGDPCRVTVWCSRIDACRHDGHGFDPIGALEICWWPWWSLVWLMSWWWSLEDPDGLVDDDGGDGASCWWCSPWRWGSHVGDALLIPYVFMSSLMHVVGSHAIWCLGAMSFAHDGDTVMVAWWWPWGHDGYDIHDVTCDALLVDEDPLPLPTLPCAIPSLPCTTLPKTL